MLRFTLRQLQYFVAAADSGSLTEASKQVHVAQPAIASAIKKLENQLDVDLIVRHHAQGISLTASGRRLLAEAKTLLRHSDGFQEQALGFSKNLSGRIELGCFLPLAPILLPSLLHGFSSKHPDIRFSVTEDTQAGLVDGLQTGRLEVALMYDLYVPSDIEQHHMYEAPLYAMLPGGHHLAGQELVSLAELAREPFILFDIPSAKNYFVSLFTRFGLTPNFTHTASSLEVLRGMVGLGLGVSMLATKPRASTTYEGHEIVTLPISDSIRPSIVSVGHLKGLRVTNNSEEFVNFCVDEYEGLEQYS